MQWQNQLFFLVAELITTSIKLPGKQMKNRVLALMADCSVIIRELHNLLA